MEKKALAKPTLRACGVKRSADPKSLNAREVASLLRKYAQRSALRSGNPYRAKAYARAADSLAALAIPLHILVEEGRLTEIPGVGDAIADIITTHRTGSHPSLEKLRKEVPAGVLELLTVPACAPTRKRRSGNGFLISLVAELNHGIDGIAVGIRFTISGLGAARCPSLVGKRDTVLGVSRSTTGLTVLFDGDRRPTCLHSDSISPAQYSRVPRLGG